MSYSRYPPWEFAAATPRISEINETSGDEKECLNRRRRSPALLSSTKVGGGCDEGDSRRANGDVSRANASAEDC